jgi:hypothetical protein
MVGGDEVLESVERTVHSAEVGCMAMRVRDDARFSPTSPLPASREISAESTWISVRTSKLSSLERRWNRPSSQSA